MKLKLMLLIVLLSLLLFTSCDNQLIPIKSDNSTIEPELMKDVANTRNNYQPINQTESLPKP